MTEQEQQGVVNKAIGVADKVATNLPAQFLALVLLNLFFIMGLMWFLRWHESERINSIEEVLKTCTEGLAHSAPAK